MDSVKAEEPGHSEQRVLAMRKAEMLRNLQAAEAIIEQPVALASGAAATSLAMAPPSTMPASEKARPSLPADSAQSAPGLGDAGGKAAGAPTATLPPALGASAPPRPLLPNHATPEQVEAHRQQCWAQYYEYCSAWQKYFAQNQGEQTGAKAAQSKAKPRGAPGPAAGQLGVQSSVLLGQMPGTGRGRSGAPVPTSVPLLDPVAPKQQGLQGGRDNSCTQAGVSARGRGSAMAAWPLATAATGPLAARGAPGTRVPLPPVGGLIEDDIHSKLLGL